MANNDSSHPAPTGGVSAGKVVTALTEGKGAPESIEDAAERIAKTHRLEFFTGGGRLSRTRCRYCGWGREAPARCAAGTGNAWHDWIDQINRAHAAYEALGEIQSKYDKLGDALDAAYESGVQDEARAWLDLASRVRRLYARNAWYDHPSFPSVMPELIALLRVMGEEDRDG